MNNKILIEQTDSSPDVRRLELYNSIRDIAKKQGKTISQYTDWENKHFKDMRSARYLYQMAIEFGFFKEYTDQWTFDTFYNSFCSDLPMYKKGASTVQPELEKLDDLRRDLYNALQQPAKVDEIGWVWGRNKDPFKMWKDTYFNNVENVKKLWNIVIEKQVNVNNVDQMPFNAFLKTYAPELSSHQENVIPGKDSVKPPVPQPDVKPPAPAGKSSGYTQLNPEDILKGYPVSYGMRGDIVTLIQELLQNASTKSGNPAIGNISKTGHPDKIFGPLTLNAVKAFQTANNLNRTDGVVDGETWNKLSQAGQVNESKKMVIPKIIRKKNTLDESLKIIKENMKKLR